MNKRERFSRFEKADDIVVMKFGGTSVEDAEAIGRLIAIVRDRLKSRPVVVVSALAGVTDQLLAAGTDASTGHLGSALATVRNIYVRHEIVAGDLVYGESHDALNRELRSEFQALESLLLELDACRELTARDQDRLLGFGECISSKLVQAAMADAGLPAEHVDARSCIVTDASFGQANPIWEVTNRNVCDVVGPVLDAEQIAVMGGFIASTSSGVATTLGRGSSDYSAAIVGAALAASRIEIWTDVDGVMTADPKLCAEAQVIRKMNFEEAADLAYFGAKVLHPATLFPAMQENIPVFVLNSRHPNGAGTEIAAGSKSTKAVAAIAVRRNLGSRTQGIEEGTGGGSWGARQALVSVVGKSICGLPEAASRIFSAVADMEPAVVQQDQAKRAISFLIDDARVEEAVGRLHRLFFSPLADPSEGSGALHETGSRREGSVAELGRL